jgi:hypothetical protein
MRSRHALTQGVGGIPTETLKNVFVAAMAVVFVVEFGGHLLGLGFLKDPINFLTVLVATEIPLWFAQIMLWSRGEDIFAEWEGELEKAVQTLRTLGWTAGLIEPMVLAVREELGKLSDEERAKMVAVMGATAVEYVEKLRSRLKGVSLPAAKAPKA